MIRKKGFVVVLVTAFLTVLIIVAAVIVNMGCSEILLTKRADDRVRAHYVAITGAEILYAKLKSMEGDTVGWPQNVTGNVLTHPDGGSVVGAYDTTANTVSAEVFGIVSRGTVNGQTATVTVRYGFDSPFTNGYPVGSVGPMSLTGTSWGPFKSWVRAEGPLASGSEITTGTYIRITGDILENQPFMDPHFWWAYDQPTNTWTLKAVGDANGNGDYLTDVNGDDKVTVADAAGDPVQADIFIADDINHDGEVNEQDAFIAYYTRELNKMGYNIGEGQSGYYEGSQVFSPWSVPSGTTIIFVNGDVDMLFSDTAWWGATTNHTVVASGNISVLQPSNGGDDTLTLVSYGDVTIGGIRAGGVRGNLVVYANGDFNAYYGGRTDGTIFAEEDVDIDTVLPIPGLLNRDLNRSSVDWSDSANWPVGLPQDFNRISLLFRIKNEATEFVPIWQEG